MSICAFKRTDVSFIIFSRQASSLVSPYIHGANESLPQTAAYSPFLYDQSMLAKGAFDIFRN